MINVPELFGSMVFGDAAMKERLPADAYQQLRNTIEEGKALDRSLANVIADAMKNWAIEKGVTHYTHWFQPMTGITAGKHDSFITSAPGGKVIMQFRGKELIKGEPDASSFPSGSLRATFEARGYTAWDPSSYAFIKDGVLCIPTAFFAYGGEVLDKKTPLLLSMEALNTQAGRVLRLFGHADPGRINTTVGAEQEYFLIDREVWQKRPDLIYCGRTLLGARPPKGQELEDHYFGAIKSRVLDFMHELDRELWSLGVLAKTEHNEVAPAQHELAPVFTNGNTATDQNQLTMEIMKKVAARLGLVCLLHEKPFAGINGSGKHNNWSLSTADGVNLLEPGDSPRENAQFLLFLSAVIKAVDEYQDLLRMSVASAGNDHRLGGGEAPPAILSIFLGDELTRVIDSIDKDTAYSNCGKHKLKIGVDLLPDLPQDSTDRNRTSPFAFTGNKFEFRMLGSSVSIAGPNFVINTAVAQSLMEFADQLENAPDFDVALSTLIRDTLRKHKRIIFNGNNYSAEWVEEAERRGLSNLKSVNQALPCFTTEKSIELFTRHKVLSRVEIFARYEIMLDNYNKAVAIEAATLLDMVFKGVVPAVYAYLKDICEASAARAAAFPALTPAESERALVTTMNRLLGQLLNETSLLDGHLGESRTISDVQKLADYSHERLLADMERVRAIADELEALTGAKYWPYPSYGDLLFSV